LAVITAVDTSVLIALCKGEMEGEAWLEILRSQSKLGRLIVCEVVVAELAALLHDDKESVTFLRDLGIDYEPLQPPAALLAGNIFHAYRRTGGPREHLIPDFLIGAHALLQAEQLAAADRGYLRRYFPKLRVIGPGRSNIH
jgi:predicted nucleic acid-binding protein